MMNEWAAAITVWFVNVNWLGGWLCVGLLLAFRLTRTAAPRLRYVIALAAFFLILLAPFVGGPGQRMVQMPATELHLAVPAAPVGFDVPHATAHLNDSLAHVTQGVLGRAFFWLWLMVAVLLLARELAGHWHWRKLRRAWICAPTGVREAVHWPARVPLYLHASDGPSTVGFFFPVVVLPQHLLTDFSSAAVAQIARHEGDHVRWRDPLVNSLVRLLCAISWPAVPLWVLARLLHREREAAADRAAVAQAEREDSAAEYAASLLVLARRATRATSYGFAGTHGGSSAGLADRVQRLLAARPKWSRLRLLCGSALLLGSLVGAAFLPLAAPPDPAGKQRATASAGALLPLTVKNAKTAQPRRAPTKNRAQGTPSANSREAAAAATRSKGTGNGKETSAAKDDEVHRIVISDRIVNRIVR